MKPDRRLLPLLKRIRAPFSLCIVAGVTGAAAVIGQAYLLSRIIAGVFLAHRGLADITGFLLLFALAAVIRWAAVWLSRNRGARGAEIIKTSLRAELSARILKGESAGLMADDPGGISATFIRGVDGLDSYFSQYLPQLFFSTLIPLILLVILFPLDMITGWVLLFTAPIIPVFMVLIGHTAGEISRRQWRSLRFMSTHFLDVLQGLTTVKLLGAVTRTADGIARISDEYRRITMTVLRVAFLSALVLEMAATISVAVIAVEIGLRLLYGKILFENALFILILAPEFYQPLRRLGVHFHASMEGISAADSIFAFLSRGEGLPSAAPEPEAGPAVCSIALDAVGFTYPGMDEPVVRDITLALERGRRVALVGASGSGKTTVSRLLMGLLAPETGRIIIDGRPVDGALPSAVRSRISWLPQEPYLFHRSIRDNICLGKPDATPVEIRTAVERARLTEVLAAFPDGLETVVGERGARLSGGQAQRVALARAFLRNGDILVLDEPSASLDMALEEELQSIIRELARDKAVLIIAHRLAAIREADRILVMRDGGIVESGDHDTLMAQHGIYAKMVHAATGDES